MKPTRHRSLPGSSPTADISPELLTVFGRIHGELLTEQTAHDAVEGLAELACDIIDAADGAGVSVMDTDGTRLSVGATNSRVLAADNLQYELRQGPCVSAWSSGEPAYIANTRMDTRWPEWASAITSLGFRSCLSVPLPRTQATLGAMKVYSNTTDAFTGQDRRLLTSVARSAATLLGHIQASGLPQKISNDVKIALEGRDAIAAACGILMERFNLDRQTAMASLIRLADDASTSVGFAAAVLTDSTERTDRTAPTPEA